LTGFLGFNGNRKSKDRSRSLRDDKRKGKGKGKDEIQGSLHCALDGSTVQCFGRDDVCGGVGEQTTTRAKATARTSATAKAIMAKYRDLSTAHWTVKLSNVSVEMTFVGEIGWGR